MPNRPFSVVLVGGLAHLLLACAEPGPLTVERCEAGGGVVVGDPGDGRVHRPDYRCENGEPPLGRVVYPPGGPIPIEGSVCCPR